MFAVKKLVLLAACVALAFSSSVAKTQTSHVRIHIRAEEEPTTVDVPVDAASNGSDATSEESGSYDSEEEVSLSDESGSIDDSDSTEECTGVGESPMSVAGAEGVFCVTGQPCVADIADGACPGPQDGLEFGSQCVKDTSGVYGCKPKTADDARKHHHKKTHHGKKM